MTPIWPAPLKSFTFSGLTDGTAYTFGLRAGNAGGTSDWVEVTETTPTPTELQWLNVSARTGSGNADPLFQFRRGTTSYVARQSMMNAGIAQVQVKADTYDPQATVTINGEAGANQSVDLSYGENLITVVVSAQGRDVDHLHGHDQAPAGGAARGAGAADRHPRRQQRRGPSWRRASPAGAPPTPSRCPARSSACECCPRSPLPRPRRSTAKPSNVNANTYVSLQRGKTNNISIVVTQGANSTTYTVAVTVEGGNSTPTVASALADISGLEPDDTQNVSLAGVFTDADSDPLTVTAESSDTAVATVSVASDGASLTVTAVKGRHRDDHRDR